jgi:2-polyprenyl-6-methoxyphenol hydroxylase-like FAD-dependent oxidoreductase
MKVVIVGAGLAGPLLAQGLTRSGSSVMLYERDAADRFSQGYRIHIAPEGDLALRACLPAHLYKQVLATAGHRGSGWRVLDPQLRVLQETLIPPSAEEETGGRHLTVDRLTLRRILIDGIDVRYGAPFERFELLADGRVRAYFGDGSLDEADLLVAADGTHSRIRAQLLPDAEVTETGQWEIYGKIPLTDEARALAPAAALDGFCAIVGSDGRFMPLAAHRFQSGGDDYIMFVVVAPAPRFPAELSTLDGVSLMRVAEDLVADWHPNLGALIRRADPGTVHTTTIRTAQPVPHWPTGPVTLMGDAIHTMVPQGTSAAVALRDAALLCRRLTEGTGGSLLDAVRAYETEMLEYGFAEVERAQRPPGGGTGA